MLLGGLLFAKEVNYDACLSEDGTPTPPLAIERLKNGWVLMVSGRDGQELAIRRVIADAISRWHFLKFICGVVFWCQRYARDPLLTPLVGE